MTADAIPYVRAVEIQSLLPPTAAVDAIQNALQLGLDPSADHPRIHTEIRHGQFLLMPSDIGASAGVKVATVAPHNPAVGLPRINAIYLLFDAETLTPRVIFDGTALTALRTPAVSIAAVQSALLRSTAPLRVVIYGAGPQAAGHATTLAAVLNGHRRISSLTHVVRRPTVYSGIADNATRIIASGSAEAEQAVQQADVIVCATTASKPLFDSRLIREAAIVIAVGSHEPHVREVDSALCRRAQVIVEDIGTATRECGDIVLAIADGAIRSADLLPMRDVVTGCAELASDRPIFFKGSGMSWQDLVVAEAIESRLGTAMTPPVAQ